MDDRFTRGYAAAILVMIILSVAFVTTQIVIQELEEPRIGISTLRKIHRRDQEAARHDQ